MRKIIPLEQNPALREAAKHIPLSDIDSGRIKNLIKDLRALLAKEKLGVAIAASQVGESVQLFVVSGKALTEHARGEAKSEEAKKAVVAIPDQIYINPRFLKTSRAKKEKHEGCLSIRGLWGMVPRAEKVTLQAYNERGSLVTRGASGFLAHIFQHEMDHLEGVVYTDKATKIYIEEEKGSEQKNKRENIEQL